jgi:hypothetical protein
MGTCISTFGKSARKAAFKPARIARKAAFKPEYKH